MKIQEINTMYLWGEEVVLPFSSSEIKRLLELEPHKKDEVAEGWREQLGLPKRNPPYLRFRDWGITLPTTVLLTNVEYKK